MTDVYLAIGATDERIPKALALWDWDEHPMPILISFFYIHKWREWHECAQPSKLMLDSGAFSAWNCGAEIDIAALTKEAKREEWNEAVALDVVGDPEATLKNTRWMRQQGAPVYPVFHIGEPWEYLERYCEEFGKVGLSCRFGEAIPASMRWLEQCFARAWPHKFHSFGWSSENLLRAFPFASVDSSSWFRAPAAWGTWKSFGGRQRVVGLRAEHVIPTNEIQVYWEMQQRAKHRWGKELLKCKS